MIQIEWFDLFGHICLKTLQGIAKAAQCHSRSGTSLRHNRPEGRVLVTKETRSKQILMKIHLLNLNQGSALRLNLNFKILTKPSFRIFAKNNLHNLNRGSAAKYWLNWLDKNLILWPNFSFQICTELSSTRFSESTSAIITTSQGYVKVAFYS